MNWTHVHVKKLESLIARIGSERDTELSPEGLEVVQLATNALINLRRPCTDPPVAPPPKRTYRVFRATRIVSRRKATRDEPFRYRVELVVRGSGGSVLYCTPAMDTREAAHERAKKYISKHPDIVDTTEHE